MQNSVFKRYYARLRGEGVLKALLISAIAAFSLMFALSLVFWMIDFKLGLLIAVGVPILLAAVLTPVLYFAFFRPSASKIAARVDRLGLEERLVTMLELGKDDSYIALKQREDAKEKLGSVSPKEIKYTFSKKLLASVSTLGVFACAMLLVAALAEGGLIPRPSEMIDPPGEQTFLVSYLVEGDGYIEGDAEQVVVLGEDADTVVAIPEEGWTFSGWDDELESPVRTDRGIVKECVYTAIFEEIDDGEDGGEGGEADLDPSDEPTDDNDNDGDGNESDDRPSPPNDNAGGKYENHDQILDGETYYRDLYEDYYQKMMEYLASGEEIPSELREIIEAYFNILL